MSPAPVAQNRVKADFERVADALGRAPTTDEYNSKGRYSAPTVASKFGDGSYPAAVRALGYEPPNPSPDPVARAVDVRRDFERVVAQLGHVPSYREYNTYGEYSATTLAVKFPESASDSTSRSFNEAVRSLGYEPQNAPPDDLSEIPAERVAADFERVVDQLGRVPAGAEYSEHGKYSASSVAKKFDKSDGDGHSYNTALHNLGYEPPNPRRSVSDADLLRDLVFVIDTLGHVPTRDEYTEHGEHSGSTLAERFGDGSFNDAIHALGYTPQNPRPEHVDPANVKADFERVVSEIGHVPSHPEYQSHGEYPASWIGELFGDGSYQAGVEHLGYEYPYAIATENLRKDLAAVAEKLRHQPTRHEYEEHGTFPVRTVTDRLDNAFALSQ